ncbi:MAG TPA: hypothetical protein VFU10_08995 [Gaiellaceae bacterium]|nr:hypothetical protein [Gaiellaceae bacterium]
MNAVELSRSYARPRPTFAFSALLPLLVVPGLLVARELPETGVGLALRLAFATGCILLPGFLVARALSLRGIAATLPLALAAVALALTVMFAVGGSIETALLALAVLTAAALPFAVRGVRIQPKLGTLLVLGGGAVLGAALWRVAPALSGDALFHLARVRKLDALNGLSLHAVDEFIDGGLHPGYAFPLWHGFLAMIAHLAGVDPSLVVRHEASILAPLAVLVAYEAGHALFNSRAAAVAVAVAQVGLIALAPGSGGAYNALALPPTASRQLLVPAAIALFFVYLRDRSTALLPALAASGLAIALVHPTYAVFLAVPLAGYLVARTIMAHPRGEFAPAAIAFGAFAAPMVAVSGALLPIVHKTVSHDPGANALHAAIAKYPDQLDVFSDASYRLAPEVFGRGGAIAIAALLLLPLAALVPRRRWSAFVLGGSLAVLTVTLTSALFPTFADLVSISQARRAAGFLPFAFAFAGGALVLASLLRYWVLPLALAAGIGLQVAFPGDFGYRLHDGGPAYVTWAAVLGGWAAFAVAAVIRWPGVHERAEWLGALAAILFVLPVGVHAAANWSTPARDKSHDLTPGLRAALKSRTSPGQVVFSDADTSYRIGAFLPVYVATDPPAHVADTTENRPYERYDDSVEFLNTGDLSIPRRYGAEWIVINRHRNRTPMTIRPVWHDGKYFLYRLR